MARPREQDSPAERRREERVSPAHARVILETSVFIDTVPLINIGRRGFSVQTPLAYPTGTPVWLTLPDHSRHAAEVVWYANAKIGARFVEPLAEEVFAGLVSEV